jgi:hypothetical protein
MPIPAQPVKLRNRLVPIMRLVQHLSAMLQNLIAAKNQRAGVPLAHFAGFHLSQGIGEVARLGLFGPQRGGYHLFVNLGWDHFMRDRGLRQKLRPDLRAGGEDDFLRHVDNPVMIWRKS